MGCDIHMVLERRTKEGDWVGLHECPSHQHSVYDPKTKTSSVELVWWPATSRNYERFAKLAGVRGDGPEPKGIPVDASKLSWIRINDWDSDGHSHSFLSLTEALPIFQDTGDAGVDYPMLYYFGLWDDAHVEDYRIVFWFDN